MRITAWASVAGGWTLAGLWTKIQDEVDLPKLTVVLVILVWVLLDDKHHEQKHPGRKGFISPYSPLGREVGAGTLGRGHRGLLLQPCCFSLLSYSTWTPSTEVALPTHSDLGALTSLTHHENVPQTCLQANQVGAFFSSEVSSFKMTLAYVNLT